MSFVIDMSAIEFELTRSVIARLVAKDVDGVAIRNKDMVKMNKIEKSKIWFISAKNVPADSNIELAWDE